MTAEEFINRTVGTPYLEGGVGDDGMDCYGLVVAFYAKVLGVALPVWSWDGSRASGARLMATARANNWKELAQPADNCVVAGIGTRYPHHVGVYLGGRVLHSAKGAGVRLETLRVFGLRFTGLIFGAIHAG